MNSPQQFVAIYTSDGNPAAFLVYPYIYNRQGQWIGWVTRNRHVYSVEGNYVGWLNDEPRILRKQSTSRIKPRLTPPPTPVKLDFSEAVSPPLQLPALKTGTYDVLLDAPELLPCMEISDLQKKFE